MIADGRVAARRSPRPRTTSTGSPQMVAARSTGHSSSRAESSGQPTVCDASHASSAAPASRITRISPRASAASVPGRGATCSSHRSAVGDRSGSMQTTCAPAARASLTYFHTWMPVDSGLAPQMTISRAAGSVSGSMQTWPPRVAFAAARQAAVQMVVSSRDVPIA